MQITDIPVTSSQITVEGVSFVQESVEFITEEGHIINASKDVVAAAFPDTTDLEKTILDSLPVSLKVSKKGSDIICIEL